MYYKTEPAPQDLVAIAEICRRLNGIPLAIELAATRAATLGINGVRSSLNNCFVLLTQGRRTALPRHQTLRATLDWSYDLLSEAVQRLLASVAVFAGGFTLDAAGFVTSEDGNSLPAAVEHAASLVENRLSSRISRIMSGDGGCSKPPALTPLKSASHLGCAAKPTGVTPNTFTHCWHRIRSAL